MIFLNKNFNKSLFPIKFAIANAAIAQLVEQFIRNE